MVIDAGVIQSLCKPPKWCMIYSTPFGGFYYGKKKRRFTTERCLSRSSYLTFTEKDGRME